MVEMEPKTGKACPACGSSEMLRSGCFSCENLVARYRHAVYEANSRREEAKHFEQLASELLQKIIDRGLTP